jgi:hypothetical protein
VFDTLPVQNDPKEEIVYCHCFLTFLQSYQGLKWNETCQLLVYIGDADWKET